MFSNVRNKARQRMQQAQLIHNHEKEKAVHIYHTVMMCIRLLPGEQIVVATADISCTDWRSSWLIEEERLPVTEEACRFFPMACILCHTPCTRENRRRVVEGEEECPTSDLQLRRRHKYTLYSTYLPPYIHVCTHAPPIPILLIPHDPPVMLHIHATPSHASTQIPACMSTLTILLWIGIHK